MLQHDNSTILIWDTNGTGIVPGNNVIAGPGTDFHVVQGHTARGPTQLVGDYDGNHTTDILLQDNMGHVVVWFVQDNQATKGPLVGTLDHSQTVGAAGDFSVMVDRICWYYTGMPPMVVQSQVSCLMVRKSGRMATQPMVIVGTTVPGGYGNLVGVGDFNNDGRTDILWQRPDGVLVVSNPSGQGGVIGHTEEPPIGVLTYGVLGNPDTTGFWKADKVGDFNGDGHADLLLRSNNNDYKVELMMNGVNSRGVLDRRLWI